MLRGRFFDGLQATGHSVELELRDGWLTGRSSDGQERLHWPQISLMLVEASEDGRENVIGCRDFPHARLLIAASEGESWRAWLPCGGKGPEKLSLRPGTLMVWLLAAGLLTGMAVAAVPMMAHRVVEILPPDAETALGEIARNYIVADHEECLSEEGKLALDTLVHRLQPEGMKPALKVTVIKHKQVNALALPDAQIVILSPLLEQSASAEEVAGVLAHEMGHVAARHPMHGVVRALGLQGLMKLLLGGTSADTVTGMAAFASQMRYQQGDERDADDYAHSLLERQQIDPNGLADFFARLEEGEHKKGTAVVNRLFGYFSSHPGHHERMARFRREGGDYRPVLTAEQWKALKNGCQRTKAAAAKRKPWKHSLE